LTDAQRGHGHDDAGAAGFKLIPAAGPKSWTAEPLTVKNPSPEENMKESDIVVEMERFRRGAGIEEVEIERIQSGPDSGLATLRTNLSA